MGSKMKSLMPEFPRDLSGRVLARFLKKYG